MPGSLTPPHPTAGSQARLDAAGHAVMLLLPSELPYLKELKSHGLKLIEMAPGEIIGSLVGGQSQGGSLSQHAKDAASTLQLKCEQRVAMEGR